MMPDPNKGPWHNPGCQTAVMAAVMLIGFVLAAVILAVG